jgi:hypothetical protein
MSDLELFITIKKYGNFIRGKYCFVKRRIRQSRIYKNIGRQYNIIKGKPS